jgi:hypothetical protein
MSTRSNLQAEVEEFFGSYRQAVERRDAANIADHFAYPAHVTSDVGTVALVPVTSKADWTKTIEDLLGMYRKIGFHSAVLQVTVTELSSLLVQGRVHWVLNDAAGALLYDFDATYTLGRFDHRLKIASAVSHDEIPRYRACVARLAGS